MRGYLKGLLGVAAAGGIATPAMAQFMLASDSGDTGWMLAACLIALLAIGGVALMHAGAARTGSTTPIAQYFGIGAAVSLLWTVIGYSIAFGVGGPYIGGIGNVLFSNMASVREGLTIPESAFAFFTMIAAILAAALVVSACAERARAGWAIGFSLLWSLLVFAPIARWVWGGGWLQELGTLDFGGGLVVSTSAGVSALVAVRLAGRRRGLGGEAAVPGNAALVYTGLGLLWLGWFGLAGGAALGASDDTGTAMLNVQIAAASGVAASMLLTRMRSGSWNAIGIVTGTSAALAAILPAAGYVGPAGALVLGLVGALLASGVAGILRKGLKMDDALNVFAAHGIGGITGALLLPLFVLPALGGPGYEDGVDAATQFVAQFTGVTAVVLWSILGTLIAASMAAILVPIRIASGDAEG